MKLLFIGAHPADLIDLAAGTIANHVKAGDDVYTLAVTLGIYSHPVPDHMMEDNQLKIKEASQALNILKVPFENQQYGHVKEIPPFEKNSMGIIAVRIRQFKPDVVITHHPAESHHPDHAKIGQQTMEAFVAAARFFDSPLPKHQVSNIFFYGYQFHPNMVKLGKNVVPPDVVVDITEVIDTKAKAFMAMPSQYNTQKVVWARLNSMEKEWGRQYGFEYAETFISYQPCRTTLLPDFGDANFQSLLRKQAGTR